MRSSLLSIVCLLCWFLLSVTPRVLGQNIDATDQQIIDFFSKNTDKVSVEAGPLLSSLMKAKVTVLPKAPTAASIDSTTVTVDVDPTARVASASFVIAVSSTSSQQWSAINLFPAATIFSAYSVRLVEGNASQCKSYVARPDSYNLFVLGECRFQLTGVVQFPIKTSDTGVKRLTRNSMMLPLPPKSVVSNVTVVIPHTKLSTTAAAKTTTTPSTTTAPQTANGEKTNRSIAVRDIAVRSSTGNSDTALLRGTRVDEPRSCTVATVVASCDTVELKWTSVTESYEEAVVDAAGGSTAPVLDFSAEQNVVFVLADQLLVVDAGFSFHVTSGELQQITLAVPAGLKVLDVTGSNVRDWNIVEQSNRQPSTAAATTTITPPTTATTFGNETLLVVVFSSSRLALNYVSVHAELDTNTTSAQLELAGFRTIDARREVGQVAVYRTSNLEVRFTTLHRVVRISPEQGNENLTLAGSPQDLVGLFKFSISDFSVGVSVRLHEDIEVETCVAERGTFVCTLTEEGALCRLRLAVRNMDRQYLEVFVAANHSVWSAHVDGQPVKAAADEPGRILLPLQLRTSLTAHEQTVELVFFTPEVNASVPTALLDRTNSFLLSLLAPVVDIPIIRLGMWLYLPFKSDVRYSIPPPTSTRSSAATTSTASAAASSSGGSQTQSHCPSANSWMSDGPQHQQQHQQHQQQQYRVNVPQDYAQTTGTYASSGSYSNKVKEREEDFYGNNQQHHKKGRNARGALSVYVEQPTTDICFFSETLLVLPGAEPKMRVHVEIVSSWYEQLLLFLRRLLSLFN